MLVSSAEILDLLRRTHLFKALNDVDLLKFKDKFEAVMFEAGRMIYEQNAPATHFYLIINGSIKVEMEGRNDNITLSILKPDDYFGEDVLEKDPYRRTKALALKDTILLRINREELLSIIEEFPLVVPAFNLILASYRYILKYRGSWFRKDEAIYYLNRTHLFFLYFPSLLPILLSSLILFFIALLYFQNIFSPFFTFLFGGIIGILGIGWTVWNIIDWSNDYFLITDQRAVYYEKVALLYESRQETPLRAILSLSKKTDLLGRNLSFGNVEIRTFTGILHFRHLPMPDQVISLLEEKRDRSKKLMDKEEQEEMDKVIRERLAPEIMKKDVKEIEESEILDQAIVDSGSITSFLAQLFGMRVESEDVITYRTHWFILLKKIIFPTLLLITLFLLALLHSLNILSVIPSDIFYPFIIASGIGSTGWWMYRFIDWRNDMYIITDDQVVDVNRKPLGLEDRRAAPIKNIQSIEYKRLGVFGLLFNFGTVFIRIGDAQFTFDHVYNPSEIQRELFERYSNLIKHERDTQSNRERQRMADWMDAYHRVIGNQNSVSSEDEEDKWGESKLE